ncbi:MAG: GDSL-type esterase/lipase family protein [Bacteroidota bacterium]
MLLKKYAAWFIGILFIVLVGAYIWQVQYVRYVANRLIDFNRGPAYAVKEDLHGLYPRRDSMIVMFGNSITEGVDWRELMDRSDIINRGIPGDDTKGMYNRIGVIAESKPKLICVMAGINDMLLFGRSNDVIFESYTRLLAKVKEKKIRLLVFSTLHVLDRQQGANERINALNTRMQAWCLTNNIEYMDLNPELSVNGSLAAEYTSDGLHLSAAGYMVWGLALSKKLNEMAV